MRLDEKLRILGSVGVIVGYIVLTHVHMLSGVAIHFLSDAISVPYFIRTKSWDVVVCLVILTGVSISKLSLGVP